MLLLHQPAVKHALTLMEKLSVGGFNLFSLVRYLEVLHILIAHSQPHLLWFIKRALTHQPLLWLELFNKSIKWTFNQLLGMTSIQMEPNQVQKHTQKVSMHTTLFPILDSSSITLCQLSLLLMGLQSTPQLIRVNLFMDNMFSASHLMMIFLDSSSLRSSLFGLSFMPLIWTILTQSMIWWQVDKSSSPTTMTLSLIETTQSTQHKWDSSSRTEKSTEVFLKTG